MPMISVKVIKDVYSPDQYREIIRRLTDAMVGIEGENLRSVTWVTIEEVNQGAWGIGGQPLTAADVHKLQRGESAA